MQSKQAVGVLFGVVTLALGASGAAWVLVDDFSGSTVDDTKWTTTNIHGSVTIEAGQLKTRTDASASAPYGFAYACMKRYETTDLSLSMCENQTLGLALDFQVSSSSDNQYGLGVQLRLAATGAKVANVNIYGTNERSLIGNDTDYIYNAFGNVFNTFHAQITLSVGAVHIKIYAHDPAATEPGDYASETPVAEWTRTSGTVLNTIYEKFNILLCGSISQEPSTVSEVFFDNVFLSGLTVNPSATMWELIDDFSGATVDAETWAATSAKGSVTIEDGRLKTRTEAATTPPNGYAYAGLKRKSDTELTLSMFPYQTFVLALDFEVAAVTKNQFGNGIQLRFAGSGGTFCAVNVYGTSVGSLIGNLSNDYIYPAFPSVFNRYHVEMTLSVGRANIKVYAYDPAATGPEGYATQTPVVQWTRTIGTVLASTDEAFKVFLCGSISQEPNVVSEVRFDNVYTRVATPRPTLITIR